MRLYWQGGYIREVAMERKYNENSIEEEKQGASIVRCCGLLARNLPYSAPRPLQCDLISVFLFSNITPQSNYRILCFLLSLSRPLIWFLFTVCCQQSWRSWQSISFACHCSTYHKTIDCSGVCKFLSLYCTVVVDECVFMLAVYPPRLPSWQ